MSTLATMTCSRTAPRPPAARRESWLWRGRIAVTRAVSSSSIRSSTRSPTASGLVSSMSSASSRKRPRARALTSSALVGADVVPAAGRADDEPVDDAVGGAGRRRGRHRAGETPGRGARRTPTNARGSTPHPDAHDSSARARPFDDLRAAFDRLATPDKAAFVLEATFEHHRAGPRRDRPPRRRRRLEPRPRQHLPRPDAPGQPDGGPGDPRRGTPPQRRRPPRATSPQKQAGRPRRDPGVPPSPDAPSAS